MDSNDYKLIAEAYFGESENETPQRKQTTEIGRELLEIVKRLKSKLPEGDEALLAITACAQDLLTDYSEEFNSEQMKQVLDKYNPKPPAQ